MRELSFLFGLLTCFSVCQTIFLPKKAIALKYAANREIRIQKSNTKMSNSEQSANWQGVTNSFSSFFFFFFLRINPIHARQKSYLVSVMVWLYYCAFHEIHLKRWSQSSTEPLEKPACWGVMKSHNSGYTTKKTTTKMPARHKQEPKHFIQQCNPYF